MSDRSRTSLLSVLVVALGWATSAAQVPLYTFYGTNVGDAFGWSVSGAPSVDGDGVPDIVIGAPDMTNYAGIPTAPGGATVISGATGAQIYALSSGAVGSYFGHSVRGLGDVDADGYGDVAVGAPVYCLNAFNCGYNGRVIAFSGATGQPIHTAVGLVSGETFGFALDIMGDMNGDGVTDYVATGPMVPITFGGPATIRFVSGANGAFLPGQPSVGSSGTVAFSVANVGDVTADGIPDIQTAAVNGGNPSWIVYPGTGGPWAAIGQPANCANLPAYNTCGYGASLAGIGDVDYDGIPDRAVGVRNWDFNGLDRGQLRVYSGITNNEIYSADGDLAQDRLGTSARGRGDFNGDGIPDIVVGAEQAPCDGNLIGGIIDSPTSGSGYLRVYSGIDGSVLTTIRGFAWGQGFGHAVDFIGDINADGCDDIVVGAPYDDTVATDAGAAYVFLGYPALACAAGTVGASLGQLENVLSVNGSIGGPDRRVNVGFGQPVTLAILQPSTMTAPAPFALWAHLGTPAASAVTPLSIGSTCFPPASLLPATPWLATIANSLFADPSALVPSGPAPWSLTVPNGLPFAAQFMVQGVVQYGTTGGIVLDYGVTNSILIVAP